MSADNAGGIHDLICADEARSEFEKLFPAAKFEDASDDIHESRFSVEIPDLPMDDYFKELLKHGLHNISFLFGMAAAVEGRGQDALKRAIAGLKEAKP
jgi:hypothetical protein